MSKRSEPDLSPPISGDGIPLKSDADQVKRKPRIPSSIVPYSNQLAYNLPSERLMRGLPIGWDVRPEYIAVSLSLPTHR